RLVEQHRFHRRRARGEKLGQPPDGRQVVERVEAEQADRRLGRRIVAQSYAAQAPRVGKHDLTAVVEHEVQLEKARRPLALVRAPPLHHEPMATAAAHLDPAGHAEVKARPGPAVELEPEVLAVAFGLPGVQLYGIVTAFRDEPIRFITVRHEGSSTYMADGYARAGGGIGVAVAVPGPGLLNAAAGLNTAYSASSRVLMIAGQIPRHQIGKKLGVLHELDNQLDAIAGSTKWRQSIMQVADAPRIVHE